VAAVQGAIDVEASFSHGLRQILPEQIKNDLEHPCSSSWCLRDEMRSLEQRSGSAQQALANGISLLLIRDNCPEIGFSP
jgi:hypothetical protein